MSDRGAQHQVKGGTMTTAEAVPAAVLATPAAYKDPEALYAALAAARRDDPVSLVEVEGYTPFWAVTRYADIIKVERAAKTFTNSPRPVLMTAEQDRLQQQVGIDTLIHMDGAKHRQYRAIGVNWFKPSALAQLQEQVNALAKRFVDKLAAAGGECDFVQTVGVDYPLYVIMSLLGIPEDDFAFMLKLTQELVGNDDPELQRGTSDEENMMAMLDMFAYFQKLTENRRANPTDDLASAIANATVDGAPLDDIQTVSYYAIVATAGHDTTSSSITGGLQALIENPDQLAKLRDNPDLMPTAVEEMIRWVTPVKEFMRTAAEDTELHGKTIKAGDAVLLSYVSANRDEDAFDDPFAFNIEREPNKHLAFGHGLHFCLGAPLARMEIAAFFTELLSRLDHIELAGEPQLTATTFVGGLKHLPIRYSLR